MSYEQIDLVLFPWAKTHGLFIYTEFKDQEVRSIDIVDDAGDSYGLWVVPQSDGSINVSIAERAKPGRDIRSKTFTTKMNDLGKILESAYAVAESWIKQKGHTRTPVL